LLLVGGQVSDLSVNRELQVSQLIFNDSRSRYKASDENIP